MNTTDQYLKNHLPGESYQAIADFLESRYSDLTQETYRGRIKRFVELSGSDPLEVTAGDLTKWVAIQVKEGRHPETIRSCVTALRSLFNFLADTKAEYIHPTRKFRLKLGRAKNEDVFLVRSRTHPISKLQEVIRRIEGAQVNGKPIPGAFLFRFLLESGMRLSEALSLDYFDPSKAGDPRYCNYLKLALDEDGSPRYMIKVIGKANRIREFQLSLAYSAILKDQLEEEGFEGKPIFINRSKRRLSRFAAHAQVVKIKDRFMADLDMPNFTIHSLRHSLITHLIADKNQNPLSISKSVGNSVDVINRYYLSRGADVLKDLQIIPSL